jgi:hypothetical protein
MATVRGGDVETLVHLPRHLRVFEALVDAGSGRSERRAA